MTAPEQDYDRFLYPRYGDPVPKLKPGGRCTAHTYRPNTPWQCAVRGCPGQLPPDDRPTARPLTPHEIAQRDAAEDLAHAGWEVFPLKGKVPAIPSPHPKATKCDGTCGQEGHGVLDATASAVKIWEWWAGDYAGANIGARVPAGMIVVDTDPRKDGIREWDQLVAEHGLPNTLTVASGRGDGGLHRYFWHPGGKVTHTRLPEGVDLKTHGGYCVVPPSIHPDSGKPYTWVDAGMPADLPPWLLDLIRVVEKPRQATGPRKSSFEPGTSLADQFSASTTWPQILEPHGLLCASPDGDEDGAVWLHPKATSKCSATVRNGCLFVYSTNGGLPVTEAGSPQGLTRFRAYAHLDHGGNLSRAWEALGGKRPGTSSAWDPTDLIGGRCERAERVRLHQGPG